MYNKALEIYLKNLKTVPENEEQMKAILEHFVDWMNKNISTFVN